MSLDVRELLVGDVVRMRYVRRFNTCRVITPETVAEHVAFTAIYSLLVGKWVQRTSDMTVDFGLLLSRALVHDIEEVRTGDFPRPYKYGDETLREALEASAEKACLDVFAGMNLDFGAKAEMFALWKLAKDDTLEGRILAFADFLSAVSFIVQEISAGNQTMKEHTKTCSTYLKKFYLPEYKFLYPLTVQVAAVVQETFK